MFISRITLKNWKNFRDVDVTLQERVFIVGANASGKSNFLDAIRFLRDLSKDSGGLQHAVDQRGGVSKIRCLSARSPSFISISIELAEVPNIPIWKYEVGFTQIGGGVVSLKAKIVRERAWNSQNELVLKRPNDFDDKDERLLQYTHLEQPTSNFKFRAIADFLKEIHYLHVVPHLVRSSKQIVTTGNQEDYYGKDLIERMNKITEKTRASYFKKIEQALQYAVPQFTSIKLITDQMGIPHLETIYKHWRPQGAKQWEDQFSDGTLRLIGLFWALLDGNKPVLLEEPELSLHSAIVGKLAEIIARLQKRKIGIRQVILSTHSFELLNNKGISGEETILLSPEHEGTTAKIAGSDKEIKALLEEGMSVAEAVVPLSAPEHVEQLSFLNDIGI